LQHPIFAPLAAALIAAAPPPVADPVQTGTDIAPAAATPPAAADYIKRVVEVPMRDGVTLHTVIVLPKNAHGLPILLTRTPYDADGRAARANSTTMLGTLPQGDEVFVRDGYIRVFQDIRGKYGSKGDYVMTRPPIGPLNPTRTDDTTDAYDTIDWLVKNTPESNGRVGMLGSSYEGWTVVMALLGPHPALKVAAPESPMVDGWMGDDWFHYGAFRQVNIDYFTGQTSKAGKGDPVTRSGYDDYASLLAAGSAGRYATAAGLGRYPFWQRLSTHPAYDGFWQGQALDKAVVARPSTVPTMWIQGLWDQEDMYGAVHSWEELRAAGHGATNHLVMGPWRHSQVNYDGRSLGPLQWSGDTATDFRRDVLLPFFDTYLKDRAPAKPTPEVLIYNTGEDHWDRFADWPGAAKGTPLYLQPGFGLGFDRPAGGGDSYVSDPTKPVPYLPQPVAFADSDRWKPWLVSDQRFAGNRPDVLAYSTPVLTAPVRVEGAPIADLFAATTGTDADWVVKVIDVYPPEMPDDPKMGGYQLAVSLDIFRGRYRESFEHPSPIPAGKVQEYRFRLPTLNHVFQPGHRIMVQIQSTLFPLYDRNPQSYVPNIFYAEPGDYRKVTLTVEHGGAQASAVWLPVVATSTAEK
jgi:putative CocE/NonD family hydrolase